MEARRRFPALIAPASLKGRRRHHGDGDDSGFPALIAPASLKGSALSRVEDGRPVFRR